MLDIEDLVTKADAMSCQKEIADQIITQKTDYILAIKDNHQNFKPDIEHEFNPQANIPCHQSLEKDHGASKLASVKWYITLNSKTARETDWD